MALKIEVLEQAWLKAETVAEVADLPLSLVEDHLSHESSAIDRLVADHYED